MASINVTATIAKIEQIAATHNIELPPTFQKIKARANDPVLYVGLIGEFSSGKSTLVNAWMGDNLLKTDILQATTAAPTVVQAESTYQIGTVLNNGDKIISEKFNQENVFKDKLLDFLHKASAQEEYSKNIKLVSFSYPNLVLQEKGFALIDTPGANAENDRHKEISGWAVEELCDVAIVIIPANIPYSESLDSFIKTYLKNSFQKCVFVMTKVDSIRSRRENELEDLLSTVKTRIETSLGIKVPEIIPFSPQLYLDAKSGTKEIAEKKQHFITEFEENTKELFKLLYEKRDRYFYLQLSDILKSLTEKLQNDLQSRKEGYQKRIEYINANMLPDLDGWLHENSQICEENINKVYLKSLDESNKWFHDLKTKTKNEIKKEIENCSSGSDLKKFMEKESLERFFNQKTYLIKNQMEIMLKQEQSDIEQYAFDEFGNSFSAVYRNLAAVTLNNDYRYYDLDISSNNNSLESLSNNVNNAVFKNDDDLFDATSGWGAIIGTFIAPGLGTFIGAAIGGLVGWLFGSSLDEKKQDCINMMKQPLNEFFSSVSKQKNSNLKKIHDFNKERVGKIAVKYKKSYQELIAEIKENDKKEKKSLEIYSVKAESNISDLVGFKKELEASDRIAIVSDAKHSYLDKVPQFMEKDFIGNSDSTLEIANLLGSSAKLTRYVDVMLLEAFSKNDSDGIVRALELDANPNLNYANGETLLIWAIRNNNYDICKILLEYGAKSRTCDKNGNPAIFIATEQKSIEIIQLLLKYGADVNATTPDQKTPLMAAVIAGESKIVDFLLAHDANPKAKDKNKLTAFKYAKQGQNQNIIDSLKEFESHKGLIFAIIAIILIIAGAAYYFLKMS